MQKKVVLLILDGWGHSEDSNHNAIAAAQSPTWDDLWNHCPHGLLDCSGNAVGLPAGQMGNSEVGHLNMGAGRLVPQALERISQAIADESFFANAVLQQVTNGKALHILGLLSPGGVHSHETHIHAMLEMASRQQLQQVYLHIFLDGRDTSPQQAQASLDLLQQQCQQLNCGRIVSVIGRYYAMDRDNRWDRIAKAYDLLTAGQAQYHASSASEALQQAYARGETDEFVQATVIHDVDATPVTIADGDSVVFMNFRADRARSLTRALSQPDFTDFRRQHYPRLAKFVSLTEYASDLADVPVAFPPTLLHNTLGEYVAAKGLRQLRIAETEKYAHVTFFFNGGVETAYTGEERILIPSPDVATYDLQPQMSAIELTDQLEKAIQSGDYPLIICNYANADMVGHTGDFSAAVQAVETIDTCLARLVSASQATDTILLITADHGNVEKMYDHKSSQSHTAHTNNLVPVVYVGSQQTKMQTAQGSLVDVAPTLLYLLGLSPPNEMTGQTLLRLETKA